MTNGDLKLSVSGESDNVKRFSKRVQIDDDGLKVSDGKGNELTIDEKGVKINGKRTKKFTFTFGGLQVSVDGDKTRISAEVADDAPAAAESETAASAVSEAETVESPAETNAEAAAEDNASAETPAVARNAQ